VRTKPPVYHNQGLPCRTRALLLWTPRVHRKVKAWDQPGGWRTPKARSGKLRSRCHWHRWCTRRWCAPCWRTSDCCTAIGSQRCPTARGTGGTPAPEQGLSAAAGEAHVSGLLRGQAGRGRGPGWGRGRQAGGGDRQAGGGVCQAGRWGGSRSVPLGSAERRSEGASRPRACWQPQPRPDRKPQSQSQGPSQPKPESQPQQQSQPQPQQQSQSQPGSQGRCQQGGAHPGGRGGLANASAWLRSERLPTALRSKWLLLLILQALLSVLAAQVRAPFNPTNPLFISNELYWTLLHGFCAQYNVMNVCTAT